MTPSTTLVASFALAMTASTAAVAAPTIQNAFPNLPSFFWPVDIQAPYDGSDRLFIVEKGGIIWVIDNHPSVSTRTKFLDISDKVNIDGSNGLLALAFHPNYENNGTFFVMYNMANVATPYLSRWARFQVSPDPDVADEASEDVFIEIDQVLTCHKGCGLVFGDDGYLYISIGDDCRGWPGQDLTTIMGKLLRIDVDGTAPGLEYAIPPDNPFAGNTQGWREEIYSYGFRNPWRFSIDPETGRIFLGDVGEATLEEIDIVSKGRNYGWDIMEGFNCYPDTTVCDTTGTNCVQPIWQYPHSNPLGAAVIGGHVYRGHTVPSLWGKYVYADVGEGIFTLSYDGTQWINQNIYFSDPSRQFVTFGVDEDDELYIASLFGTIYRFVDTATGVDGRAPATSTLVAEPNPFQTSTTLHFESPATGTATVDIYDVRGRRVRTLSTESRDVRTGQVTWNGTDDAGGELVSGVYFARLSVDGRVIAHQRMVIVR